MAGLRPGGRPWPIRVRTLTAEERRADAAGQSRTLRAGLVERAAAFAARGRGPQGVGDRRGVAAARQTARLWLKRFNDQGLAGLQERPRGRAARRPTPPSSGPRSIAAALTDPKELGLPFGSLDARPPAGLPQRAEGDRRSSGAGSTRSCWPRGCGGGTRRPGSASGSTPTSPKKGAIEQLYTAPPEGSVVVCLDEMGPQVGQELPRPAAVRAEPQERRRRPRPAGRAKQEIDYGRRGKGYIFGAFRPATGEALTAPLPEPRRRPTGSTSWSRSRRGCRRTSSGSTRSLDNLNAHRATDVLLFCLAHPRWEFVFQPKYAAYLNLIEPWWKVLRSLALKGRRFETGRRSCRAVEEATAYWNKHRHPFVWGRRRRHRPRRCTGVAALPKAAATWRMHH